MMSMDSGMLPDWRVPTGKEPYMKEALEQVVDLFRWPARIHNETECFKGINHHEKMACSTVTVQVYL